MQYVNLGSSGLSVSRICLGMMSYGDPTWRDWVLSEEEARPFVRRAFELGVNFFDTADMYSSGMSEVVTGRLLKEYGKGDDCVIATKVFHPLSDDHNDRGLSRKHILNRIDRCHRDLQSWSSALPGAATRWMHHWDKKPPRFMGRDCGLLEGGRA